MTTPYREPFQMKETKRLIDIVNEEARSYESIFREKLGDFFQKFCKMISEDIKKYAKKGIRKYELDIRFVHDSNGALIDDNYIFPLARRLKKTFKREGFKVSWFWPWSTTIKISW